MWHSSTLAWKIPQTEEPGGLQPMGSLRVGHDWATSLSLFLSCIGEGNGNPLQCSCLENPRDEGAWWAAVYGVAQSRTRLKRLSSSSSGCEVVSHGFWCRISGQWQWTSYCHGHVSILFEEMSIQILCPFKNSIVCLLAVKFLVLYVF